MRRSTPFSVALAAVALGAAGAAHAQSCAAASSSVTRCRFLLSQARIYDVRAYARLSRSPAPGPHAIVLSVDGRPCPELPAATGSFGRVIDAGCRIALPPAVHVVEARVAPATTDLQGVSIRLQPNPRLAPLPREAPSLYPPQTRPWYRRLLPF